MKFSSEKGFTLVEVMVSAALLGVGVLGMAAMQGMAFTKNADANDLSIVTNIAADVMERIQSNREYAWTYNGLVPHDRLMHSIDRFATTVLPRVADPG